MVSILEKEAELRRLTDQARTLRREIQKDRQERLRSRRGRLSPHQHAILKALVYRGDEYAITYNSMCDDAQLNLKQARRAVSALRDLGLIEWIRGCLTEENVAAGSGHVTTKAGEAWWKTVEEPHTKEPFEYDPE